MPYVEGNEAGGLTRLRVVTRDLDSVAVSQARGSKYLESYYLMYVPTSIFLSKTIDYDPPTCLRFAENIQAGGQVTIKRHVSSFCSLLFVLFNGALSLLRHSHQLSIQLQGARGGKGAVDSI